MSTALPHLLVVPVVLPLLAAAVMLTFGERRSRFKSVVNVVATLVGLLVAIEILRRVDAGGPEGTMGVYLASNWKAPFGIVLVADRLSALMLVLTGIIGLGAAVYSTAAWGRAGVYFHPLFQIQLMGLNGAFLTGDLFNLFVFFEVALAASYGLHLHGSGAARVRSGLHYIAVNLVASSLFLIGLALVYGVTGTLSMADVAAKVPLIPDADRGLLHAGAGILAVAFLIKAAIWPLNGWLAPVYVAASTPVAAVFALMTKLGIYTLLRSWTLFFSPEAGQSANFGGAIFLYGGLATVAFGVLGVSASLRLRRIAAFSIVVSSGTLLCAIGFGAPSVTAAALFYLVSSTLAASVLFLLAELVERTNARGRRSLRDLDLEPGEDTNLDDDETPLVGRVIPVSLTLLGLAYIGSVLLVAGLPPLSGFIAKFALMAAVLDASGSAVRTASITPAAWGLFALLLLSGLAATVSLSRVGIRRFWPKRGGSPIRVELAEATPILVLLAVCVWLTLFTEPVMRYARATARALHTPAGYIETVLSTQPVPDHSTTADGSRR